MKTKWIALTTMIGLMTLSARAAFTDFPLTDNEPVGPIITLHQQYEVEYAWVDDGGFIRKAFTNAWDLPRLAPAVRSEATNIFNGLFAAQTGASVSSTSFVSGQRYTNTSGVLIEASTRVSTTTALIAGGASIEMRVYDASGSLVIVPDAHSIGTALLALSPTTTASLRGKVPAGYSWSFTNTSTGAGNSATTTSSSGQLTFFP